MRASAQDGALVIADASLLDFQALGDALARQVQDGDVVFLTGQLGAGKTTFTQAVARGLGITEDVVSPTFNLVCIYESGRVMLNHFDLYRLDDPSQLDDIDLWTLVDESTPGVSLIEWADLFSDDLPDEGLSIQISYPPEGAEGREVHLTAVGARAHELLGAIAEEVC